MEALAPTKWDIANFQDIHIDSESDIRYVAESIHPGCSFSFTLGNGHRDGLLTICRNGFVIEKSVCVVY